MTFIPGYRARVLCGDFSFSAYINDVNQPYTVDMHDTTVMTDGPGRKFIPGKNTSTLALKGFLDPDSTADAQYDQINDWTGAEPVTYGPNGLALGAELWMVNALPNAKTSTAQETSPVGFSLNAQTTGSTDFGRSLHDLAADTVDASGAAYDGGASSAAGGVAHLHVTAFAGLTQAIVIVEDSANGSSGWATIGTFATVSALTFERLEIAGTIRRYTRYSIDVTGTGSISHQVGLARR